MILHSRTSSRMSIACLTGQMFVLAPDRFELTRVPDCTDCLLLLKMERCISHQQLMNKMCRPW